MKMNVQIFKGKCVYSVSKSQKRELFTLLHTGENLGSYVMIFKLEHPTE